MCFIPMVWNAKLRTSLRSHDSLRLKTMVKKAKECYQPVV